MFRIHPGNIIHVVLHSGHSPNAQDLDVCLIARNYDGGQSKLTLLVLRMVQTNRGNFNTPRALASIISCERQASGMGNQRRRGTFHIWELQDPQLEMLDMAAFLQAAELPLVSRTPECSKKKELFVLLLKVTSSWAKLFQGVHETNRTFCCQSEPTTRLSVIAKWKCVPGCHTPSSQQVVRTPHGKTWPTHPSCHWESDKPNATLHPQNEFLLDQFRSSWR